jgi:hypothetical protein
MAIRGPASTGSHFSRRARKGGKREKRRPCGPSKWRKTVGQIKKQRKKEQKEEKKGSLISGVGGAPVFFARLQKDDNPYEGFGLLGTRSRPREATRGTCAARGGAGSGAGRLGRSRARDLEIQEEQEGRGRTCGNKAGTCVAHSVRRGQAEGRGRRDSKVMPSDYEDRDDAHGGASPRPLSPPRSATSPGACIAISCLSVTICAALAGRRLIVVPGPVRTHGAATPRRPRENSLSTCRGCIRLRASPGSELAPRPIPRPTPRSTPRRPHADPSPTPRPLGKWPGREKSDSVIVSRARPQFHVCAFHLSHPSSPPRSGIFNSECTRVRGGADVALRVLATRAPRNCCRLFDFIGLRRLASVPINFRTLKRRGKGRAKGRGGGRAGG